MVFDWILSPNLTPVMMLMNARFLGLRRFVSISASILVGLIGVCVHQGISSRRWIRGLVWMLMSVRRGLIIVRRIIIVRIRMGLIFWGIVGFSSPFILGLRKQNGIELFTNSPNLDPTSIPMNWLKHWSSYHNNLSPQVFESFIVNIKIAPKNPSIPSPRPASLKTSAQWTTP